MQNPALVFCSLCLRPAGICQKGQEHLEMYCVFCARAYCDHVDDIAGSLWHRAARKLLWWFSYTEAKKRGLPSLGSFEENMGLHSLLNSIPEKKLTSESFSPLTFKEALNIVQPTTNAGRALLQRLENESR